MAEKKITRKVISPSKKDAKLEVKEIAVQTEEIKKVEETGRSKKPCTFCQSKSNPVYTDIAVLRKYLTDRAKIVARSKNSLCSKHQRVVCKQIKYARHLALLPFVPKV